MTNKTFFSFIKTGFNLYMTNPLLLISIAALQSIVGILLVLPMPTLLRAITFPLATIACLLIYIGYLRIGFNLYDKKQSNFKQLFSDFYLLPKLIGSFLIFMLPISFGMAFFILGFANISLRILTQINPATLATLNPNMAQAFIKIPLMVIIPLFIASLPLLWISMRWAFTFHVLVDKNCSIRQAIKTSFVITRGYLLHILAPIFLTMPLSLLLMYYLGQHVSSFVNAITISPIIFMIWIVIYRTLLKNYEERAELV